MDPVAFSIPLPIEGIGPLQIRWYGIAMACAMLVGAYISTRLLKSIGRDGDAVWDGLFWLILFGVVGARLAYVATNLRVFFGADADPWEIFRVWHGGLSFHGGIIAGLVTAYIYFPSRGLHFVEVMDSFAPGVSLGVVLVRLGNFMNGDILGHRWAGPWAMNFPHDEYHLLSPGQIILRHPTELYGVLVGFLCLVLAMVLWNATYVTRRIATGSAFMGFILSYCLVRGVIEDPFRAVPLAWKVVDPAKSGFGMFTYSQLAAIVLIVVALWGFTQLRTWERRRAQAAATGGRAEGPSRQLRRAARRKAEKHGRK